MRRGEAPSWKKILAIPAEEAIEASRADGIGVNEILEAIVTRIPPRDREGRNVARSGV